jgi:hypothetical protein
MKVYPELTQVSGLISSFARNRHEDVIPRVRMLLHAFNMLGATFYSVHLEVW